MGAAVLFYNSLETAVKNDLNPWNGQTVLLSGNSDEIILLILMKMMMGFFLGGGKLADSSFYYWIMYIIYKTVLWETSSALRSIISPVKGLKAIIKAKLSLREGPALKTWETRAPAPPVLTSFIIQTFRSFLLIQSENLHAVTEKAKDSNIFIDYH